MVSSSSVKGGRGNTTAKHPELSNSPRGRGIDARPHSTVQRARKASTEPQHWDTLPWIASRVIGHPATDFVIGGIILLNAISIGVEQSLLIQGSDTTIVQVLEHLFLSFYTIELVLRFYTKGIACLQDGWVRFDLFLVVLGIVTTWILEPVLKEVPASLDPLLVLRTLRLLRLVKTMRLVVKVQECWMLIRGFMSSASIIIYAFIVWFLTLYVFSCVGVELVTMNPLNGKDEEFTAIVAKYFATLPLTMLTLVRFACLDNMGEVYSPLVQKDPLLSIYFMLLVLVVSVVLFHTLGAVIFSTMLDQTTNEQEAAKALKHGEWENLVTDLRDMFIRLDTDKSGNLSRKEVAHINPDDQAILAEALGLSTPMQVFDALDVDFSGAVSISEFFDGVWEVVLAKGNVRLKRMEKQVETTHWRIKDLFATQHEMVRNVAAISDQLKAVRIDIGEIRQEIKDGFYTLKNGHAPKKPTQDGIWSIWDSVAEVHTKQPSSPLSTSPRRPSVTGPRPSSRSTSPPRRDSVREGKVGQLSASPPRRPSALASASAEELIERLQRTLDESLIPTLAQMKKNGAASNEAGCKEVAEGSTGSTEALSSGGSNWKQVGGAFKAGSGHKGESGSAVRSAPAESAVAAVEQKASAAAEVASEGLRTASGAPPASVPLASGAASTSTAMRRVPI